MVELISEVIGPVGFAFQYHVLPAIDAKSPGSHRNNALPGGRPPRHLAIGHDQFDCSLSGMS